MVERTRSADQASTSVTPLRKLKAMDDARPSAPGEHWLVLGAGIATWVITRRSPSFLLRTAGLLAGSALVGRAAAGRDGLSKLLRFTPLGRRIK